MPSFIPGQSKQNRRSSKLGAKVGTLPALTVAALLSMAVIPSYGQAEATAPVAGEASVNTQPFVGEILADRVYVRSGPGTSYYEIGQLGKGDIVNIVGQRGGWYRISPPTGTFCYLAKELVEVGGDGKVGTVKAEFANVRAASSSSPNSDYAVLTVIRRGTAVNILGSTERYYRITPPEKAFMYVAPQFVRQAAGKEYTPPAIKAPAIETAPVTTGTIVPPPPPAVKPAPAASTAPAGDANLVPVPAPKVIQETTVPSPVPGNLTVVPPTAAPVPTPAPKANEPKTSVPVAVPLPSEKINRDPVVVVTPAEGEKATTIVEEVPNPVPPVATPAPAPAPAPAVPVVKPNEKKPKVVVVAPEPTGLLNRDAYSTFNDLNKRTQEELQKPLMERQLGGLLAEYRNLLAQPNLPASVKTVTEARVGVIERIQKVQDLARENGDSSTAALNAQRQALQQQWSETEKKIEEYERTGPYLAEGKLQTSTALKNKYVLVNPNTGRVVAYVDPSAPVDLAPLIGQYIGLRGIYEQAEGLDIKVIKVRNATILPAPAAPASR